MIRQIVSLIMAAAIACTPAAAWKHHKGTEKNEKAVIWRDPGDIHAKNLFYGPGGKDGEPRQPVKFEEEDKGGTSPKFNVKDANGTKWKAKTGIEAQPETAASRLLWAVGYPANENYFVPELTVKDLPKLKRGQEFVKSPGVVEKVRLQRHEGKKKGTWEWRKNPFYGTREFNGLRVMMALLSNWDLKTENNAIYEDKDSGTLIYEVSDVGATFGRAGKSYTDSITKNNLAAYRRGKFIAKKTKTYIDFNYPTHPPFIYVFSLPYYVSSMEIRWVGKQIPLDDARWIGSLLGQLSLKQIEDAFRAAGYTPEEVHAYATEVQARIEELTRL